MTIHPNPVFIPVADLYKRASCVCVCVHVCVRACMRACVRAFVAACVHLCSCKKHYVCLLGVRVCMHEGIRGYVCVHANMMLVRHRSCAKV